jgi:hypothetical protein
MYQVESTRRRYQQYMRFPSPTGIERIPQSKPYRDTPCSCMNRKLRAPYLD